MDLAPKTRKNNKVITLDVVWSSMKRLADDSVWQYISALGRSGTEKISMQEVMPSIMDLILLTAVKVLEIDPKEATTALSTYLNNTSQGSIKKSDFTDCNLCSCGGR